MANVIDISTYHSPVGDLVLGATSTYLILCDWSNAEGNPRAEVVKRLQRYGITIPQGFALLDCCVQSGNAALLKEAQNQLNEYFSGKRRDFTIPIQTFGTPFQQQVWKQLQTILYGTTMTYKQQATALNMPKAIRAVANANRLNALSIIIPCHRVLGSNHTLTGYAGGLDAKRWLIEHERQHSSDK